MATSLREDLEKAYDAADAASKEKTRIRRNAAHLRSIPTTNKEASAHVQNLMEAEQEDLGKRFENSMRRGNALYAKELEAQARKVAQTRGRK